MDDWMNLVQEDEFIKMTEEEYYEYLEIHGYDFYLFCFELLSLEPQTIKKYSEEEYQYLLNEYTTKYGE